MMDKPLQVLLIEDDDDDAFLTIRELRRSGYDLIYTQVDQLGHLETALAEESWDLVISDYFLPGFTAAEALQKVQAKGLDIPFIVVSGTIGEDMAVAMMKAGAHDYLIKGNLKRLAPAVERELREAQVRQQKRETEEALKQAFDELEQLVAQRTSDLMRVNSELNTEIEERRRSEQRTQTQYLITRLLSEANTLEDVAPQLLKTICNNLDWQIGELWLVDQQDCSWRLIDRWLSPTMHTMHNMDRQTLGPTMVACNSPEHLDQTWFKNEQTFRPDVLPFPSQVASIADLPLAWSFPIFSDRQVLGGLLLFGEDLNQANTTLCQLMLTLGSQIGQFIRRRQAEEIMQQLAAIVQSSEDAIISLNLEGIVLSWNNGAEKVYGYSCREAIGKPVQALIQPDAEAISSSLEKAPRASLVDHCRAIHRHKQGTLIDVFITVSPIKDSLGKVMGTSVIARDISDQRAMEKMKDEFISVVSHELRTPLASLQGALELLLTEQLGTLVDRGQRMLKIAADNTDRLVRLINDIIDLQSLESGQVIFHRETCPLPNLCNQAVNVIQAMAEQANIEISLKVPPISVFADPDRMLQVLVGLLSNAVKFSPPGKTVWISAKLFNTCSSNLQNGSCSDSPRQSDCNCVDGLTITRDNHIQPLIPHHIHQQLFLNVANPNTDKFVLIRVQDEGRGIAAEDLEKIFNRFQQGDASDTRQQGGTGLGLAICRQIIHQHGGYLWAESGEGQGSTFYILLNASALD